MTNQIVKLSVSGTSVVFSDVFDHDRLSLLEDLDRFGESVKSSGVNSPSSINLIDSIARHMRDYSTIEKFLGMVQGYVFSHLSRMLSADEFRLVCESKLKVCRTTARRYALIYDAWFSGRMTYTLPEDKSPADLGVEDLALGAELICVGKLNEKSAEILFGEGTNALKRRTLLGDGVLRIEREDVIDADDDDSSPVVINPPGVFIRGTGDLVYRSADGGEYRIGILFLDDPDPIVGAICRRVRDSLYAAVSDMDVHHSGVEE